MVLLRLLLFAVWVSFVIRELFMGKGGVREDGLLLLLSASRKAAAQGKRMQLAY
jgi:hypothetical protein